MKKQLYRKPVRKKRELIFYHCRIGKSVGLIISSEEAIYWRVRDKLQTMVDAGSFDGYIERGNVFCERIEKIDKNNLTDADKKSIVAKIKRNLYAITFDELSSAVNNNTANLEQFMIGENDENYYCEVEQLMKVLPLKKISKEDYFYKAVHHRFPEFAKKLKKEHNLHVI